MRWLRTLLLRVFCHHNPVRRLGGFRCALCGLAGRSLDDFGFTGYVDPKRVLFVRGTETTRTRVS